LRFVCFGVSLWLGLRGEWLGRLPHGGVPQIVSRPRHPPRASGCATAVTRHCAGCFVTWGGVCLWQSAASQSLAGDGVLAADNLWYPTMRRPPTLRRPPAQDEFQLDDDIAFKPPQSKTSNIHFHRIAVQFHQLTARCRLTFAHQLGNQRFGLAEVDGAQRHG